MGWLEALILGLSGIIGGAIPKKSSQTTTTPSRMDPLYAALSPMMLGNMTKAMGQYSGWGGGPDLFGWNPLVGNSQQPMRDMLLAKLAKEFPRILYSNRSDKYGGYNG